MRKGDSTIVVMSVLLLIIMIYIFSVGFSGKTTGEEPIDPKKYKSACYEDEDCIEHEDGNKCLLVYPGDLEPFCGCLTNADCDPNKYCSNNRCINL